ncbi:MAG: hypothetical protein K2N90_00885 [Lachnospiraceae bacterium]|nr:hypothetical protein [Lachnospiraceae bacterium]
MRILANLHATLIAMLILPFLYALAELQDVDGEGMLYLKCLLIFIPIMVTEIAVRRLKNLGIYLFCSLGVTFALWGVIRLFFGGSGALYPIVMIAESLFAALLRFQERLRLARQQKENDLYAAPAVSLINQPSLGFLWYFAVMYAVGIIFNSKTLCDIAFWNGALYFFIALAYTYITATNHYLGLNKRTKSIPRKRLYTISAAMAGLFAALVLIAMLPSFFLAGQRRYTDIRTWSDNMQFVAYQPTVPSQTGGDDYEDDDWIRMLNEGEPIPEPSQFWTYLGWGALAGFVMFMLHWAVKMLRRLFLEFRDSFDENGDKVEELDDEALQKEERLVLKRSVKADSEAQRIRRIYRRTIRKHRKEIPAPYESPSELEKNAGLFEDEDMRQLHVKYEKVRYGREGRF